MLGSSTITRKDVWVMFICLPYFFVIDYIMFGQRMFDDRSLLWPLLPITLLVWVTSWRLHILAGYLLRNLFYEARHTLRRVVISMGIYVPLTAAINALFFGAMHYTGAFGYTFDATAFSWALIAGLMINIIATGFYEGLFLFDKWKASLVEAEELKKAHLQSQLDGLKSQVNPHFLFNSINSLSSLIHEDPDKAEEFLDEMSSVYRYLLHTNEEQLTPLGRELSFVRSYFHLLKTRYDKGIILHLDIDKKYESYLLPPLTLQLLIENAVKHNVILEQTPLRIRLWVNEQEQLVVQNNIQKKMIAIDSNKVGLANIKAKYQLLNQPDVVVKETAEDFVVTIPLIKEEVYEHTDR